MTTTETRRELQALCDRLAEQYPQAGLTFGYIGSLSHHDDRLWFFFTRIPTFGTWGHEFAKWRFGHETHDLPRMLTEAAAGLEAWLKKKLDESTAPCH